jgi:hypothetical protein
VSAAGLLASETDRAALAEVLAGPDFQAQRGWGEELRRWLAEAWERLTELLGTAEAEQVAGLGRFVFLAAAAVAALLLWRAARRRRTRGAPVAPRPPGPVALPGVAWAVVADGEQALADGDPAGAVRLAFLASVGALRRPGRPAAPRRRLRGGEVDTLTGSELAVRLADDGFTRLVGLHERTVFGRRPVTREEAAGALAVAAALASGHGPARGGVAP